MASAGSEFALAVVRFVADDSQLKAVQSRIVQGAGQTAKASGSAFSSAAIQASGEIKNQREYLRILNDSLLTTTHSTHGFTASNRAMNHEINVGIKGFKSVLGPILHMSPALSSAARGASTLLRGLGGLPTQLTASLIAFQLINQVIAHYIEHAQEAIKHSNELGVAVSTQDYGKAEAALQKVVAQYDEIGTSASIAADTTQSAFTRVVAFFNVAFAPSLANLAHQYNQAKEATELLWNATDGLKLRAETAKIALDAEGKALDFAYGRAETVSDIARITEAQKKNTLETLKQNIAITNSDAGKAASVKIHNGEMVAAMDILAKARETNAAAVIDANLKIQKSDEDAQKRLADRASNAFSLMDTLAQNQARSIKAQQDASATELDLNRKAAEAEAERQGRIAGGLDEFYAKKKALAQQAADFELENIKGTYRAQLAADTQRLIAARGNAVETKKVKDDIAKLDSKYLADESVNRTQLSTTIKQLGREEVDAKLSEINKIIALEDQKNDYLRSVGSLTIADDLAVQQARTYNYLLSVKQRQDAEVAAQRIIQKEQRDTVDLGIAQGSKTIADGVRLSGQLAEKWKEGTQQRLDAEKKFAEDVKSLWSSLAGAGRSLEDTAIDALAKQGNMAPSLEAIKEKTLQIKAQAEALNEQWQNGGGLLKEQIDLVRKWADSNATLKTIGSDALGAIGASAEKLNQDMSSTLTTTDKMAASLSAIGVSVSGRGMDKFTKSFEDSFIQITAATDSFYKTLETKIVAGNSRIADTVYEYFTNQVIRQLNAEAARS